MIESEVRTSYLSKTNSMIAEKVALPWTISINYYVLKKRIKAKDSCIFTFFDLEKAFVPIGHDLFFYC